jgi:hypothetical protein
MERLDLIPISHFVLLTLLFVVVIIIVLPMMPTRWCRWALPLIPLTPIVETTHCAFIVNAVDHYSEATR